MEINFFFEWPDTTLRGVTAIRPSVRSLGCFTQSIGTEQFGAMARLFVFIPGLRLSYNIQVNG
jgi:hypothetical protein